MKRQVYRAAAVSPREPVGPVHPHIASFAKWLAQQGYASSTIEQKIRLTAALDQWLVRGQIEIEDFNEQKIQQFLCYHWSRRSTQSSDPPTLRSLLKHLREAKVVPVTVAEHDSSPVDHVQASFGQYLVAERGLRPATVNQYLSESRNFLSERFGKGAIEWDQLTPGDIAQHVLGRARAISPNAAQRTTIALRSFLRFLQQRGDIAANLVASVPTVANWSLAGVPKHLPAHEVELLLERCDRESAVEQRDHAILLLLARLALRAGEVVQMTLDDIDWEAGELTVRGKGGRQDRLPIPQEVGQALARYLRQVRPRCSSRKVFIRLRAPHQGFAGAAAIVCVMRRALKRAGLNPSLKGAHLLRHSLATRMIGAGASLPEIGQVLRHSLPKTTALYAKVDLAALRALAQPWPGGEV